jgi:WD40 repeat protein
MADLRCYIPTCAAVLQASDEICPQCHSPQILNRIYRIHGILGSGGFGCVYDAFDMSLNNRRCAIKEIIARPPQLTRQQIEQEVNLLSNNANSLPFIPDIYSYWHDGPKHYIAMQYIDGQIVSKTRRLPWGPEEVLHFLREMLSHLAQMHAMGVVHRDIKPANIKHTTWRGYVLLDFGLATQRSSTIIQGATPDYAPIEQFYEKRPVDSYTDARSDLYSLAATAYFLLTKTKPTRADVREQGQPLKPLRHPQGIPTALEKTLLWMLELMPQDRPPSAQVAFDHLEHPNEPHQAPNSRPEQADDKVSTTPGEPPKELSNPPKELSNPLGASATQTTYQEQRAKPDRGRLNDMTWSPDGQRIAVASALGFSVYDLQAQQELFFERLHASVANVAYTHNGTALALATLSGVQIFQSREQQWLAALKCNPSDTARVMAGIPHSQMLAIATDLGVMLWKAGDTKPITTLDEEAASQITFSAGGEWLAIATHDSIKIWEQHHGQLGSARVLPLTSAPVVGLAFSRDGGVLAVATAQGISVWRTGERSRINTLHEIKNAVTGMALSPDGKTLALASDGQVVLWRIQPQRLLRTLAQGFSGIFRLEFAPNGESLAACSHAELWVWRVADGVERFKRHDHLESMHSVAFSPDGQRLAAMGGRVYVWNILDKIMTLGPILEGPSDQQNSVAFDSSGQVVAAASDASIRLWNVDTNTVVQEIPSGSAQAHGVVFADAGQALLNVAADSVEWRHVGDGSLIRTLPHPPGGPYDVAFAAGGQFLATFAGHTVTIRQDDGVVRCTLEIDSEINSVALTLDGSRLAVATEEDTQIWLIKDSPILINQRLESAQRVIFAPDGARLALLRDATILLWQLDDGVSGQLLTLAGHTEMVHDAAFAPDGATLASASQDGTVRLWMLNDRPEHP